MADFEEFLRDLDELAGRHARKGLALKVRADPESGIAKVFGDDATPLARAKDGLADALDLAHSAAEHHPLWGLLSNSADVASTALERWHGKLAEADLEEIRWSIRELDGMIRRLSDARDG